MFPVKPEPFQVDQIRPDGRGKGRMGDLIKVFPDPGRPGGQIILQMIKLRLLRIRKQCLVVVEYWCHPRNLHRIRIKQHPIIAGMAIRIQDKRIQYQHPPEIFFCIMPGHIIHHICQVILSLDTAIDRSKALLLTGKQRALRGQASPIPDNGIWNMPSAYPAGDLCGIGFRKRFQPCVPAACTPALVQEDISFLFPYPAFRIGTARFKFW